MAKGSSAADKPKLFIVFGMPRTGTTYLYHLLAKHPSIYVPYRKESHFFSVNFCRGYDWFFSLYRGWNGERICADINPMYYLDGRTIERVLEYDPNVKVILGVREPVQFAVSLYGNMLAHGLKPPPILEVVRGYQWPLTPHASLEFSLDDGFMRRRVSELQRAFGDNLMLYDFRAFERSPLSVVRVLEQFLGLPGYFREETMIDVRINASGRRNWLSLNSLLANQRVLDVLYRTLPQGVIRSARRAFERLSARSVADGPAPAVGVSDQERRELKRMLADDSSYYESLFAADSIRIGSDAGSRIVNPA